MGSCTINESGQVAFSASLYGTSGGSSDDRGIFRGSGVGNPTQLVREGDGAPDGNGSFLSFMAPITINDSAQVGFLANLTGTSGGITQVAHVGLLIGGARLYVPLILKRSSQVD